MKFLLLLLLISYFTFSYPQTNYNVEKFEYISPVPGSSLLTPQTNIIIRYGEALSNLNKSDTSIIRVEGNLSGYHAGTLYLTKDSKTIVFTPLEPFLNSEKVVVSLSSGIKTITNKNVDSLNFYFFISKNSPLL